jgi:hypothetical protein
MEKFSVLEKNLSLGPLAYLSHWKSITENFLVYHQLSKWSDLKFCLLEYSSKLRLTKTRAHYLVILSRILYHLDSKKATKSCKRRPLKEQTSHERRDFQQGSSHLFRANVNVKWKTIEEINLNEAMVDFYHD